MLHPYWSNLSLGKRKCLRAEVLNCWFFKAAYKNFRVPNKKPKKKKKEFSGLFSRLTKSQCWRTCIFILNFPMWFLESTWHRTHRHVQLFSFRKMKSGVYFGVSFIKLDFLHISALSRSNVYSWMVHELYLFHLKYKTCCTTQSVHFFSYNFTIHRNKYWIIEQKRTSREHFVKLPVSN